MIAIADSGGGNIRSLENALKRIGEKFFFAKSPSELERASKIILPGVGSAEAGMNALNRSEIGPYLKQCEKPVLGICLGMQLLYEWSEEGDTECLSLLKGKVRKIVAPSLTLPHMGWNKLKRYTPEDTISDENVSGEQFSEFEGKSVYFVHDYRADMTEDVCLYVDHGEKIPALVKSGNVWGMQFHPEKSAEMGLVLLKEFTRR